MTPPTVNAYFNPQMNDINFPAGVLQPPLYDIKLDDAPNYGNTGSTIGHELTHAFDDEGRQFDAQGNLRDWWTPADAKAFKDRIQCVVDQYAQYTVVDDIKINSKLTRVKTSPTSAGRCSPAWPGRSRPRPEAHQQRRLHPRPALLHRHGPVGLREPAPGEPPRQRHHQPPLPRLRPDQRRGGQPPRVPEGLLLQSGPAHGQANACKVW